MISLIKGKKLNPVHFAAGGLYLIVTVWLCFKPLFNVLGYEFCLLISPLAFAIGGFLIIFDKRPAKEGKGLFGRYRGFIVSFLLSMIPLAVMTVKGFFETNCNYPKGVEFFLLYVPVSALFGSSLGFFSVALIAKRFRQAVIFVALTLLTLIRPAVELLYFPNVDLYNHIFGYFAGPIYDELVDIGWPLLAYRCFTLLLSAFLVAFSILIQKLKGKGAPKRLKGPLMVVASLLIVNILFGINSQRLGFNRPKALILKTLTEKKASVHFNLYYSKTSEKVTEGISSEFEFRYLQLSDFIKVNPAKKIDLFIYPDAETQKKLMGSRGVFVSKPSAMQIHMTAGPFLNLPIKHELTHVMAGDFGFPIIKISPRIVFLEGLAEAADWFDESMTVHQYAKALIRLNLLPEITEILGPRGFWSSQSFVAYKASGSFVRFLIDRYGMEKFKKVYGGKGLREVYSRGSVILSKEWLSFLEGITIGEDQLKEAEIIFKPKGIFEKRCPHEVASLIKTSSDLLKCGETAHSTEVLKDAVILSGGYPWVEKRYMSLLYRTKRCNEAADTAGKLILKKDISPNIAFSAYDIAGDCSADDGNAKNAAENYEKGILSSIFPEQRINLKVKSILASASLKKDYLAAYLKADSSAEKIKVLDDFLKSSGRNPYLLMQKGLLELSSNDPQRGMKTIRRVLRRKIPAELRTFLLTKVGEKYFFMKRYDRSIAVFARLAKKSDREAFRLYCEDWIERIELTQRTDSPQSNTRANK